MKNSIDKGNHMGELVVKSNDLINASYNLGVVEQRLLLLCIIAARKKDRVLSPSDIFYIHASEYIEQFDVDRSVAYRALAEGIKGIYDSEIKLTSKNSRKKINIRCFNFDPSISSSLKFLRKTPWAREKVEKLYLNTFSN